MKQQVTLPAGWKWSTLGDVAHYTNGKAFKPEEWGSTGLPIVRIQNLNSPEVPFNYFDGLLEERYRVRNGDLLISWSASLDAYIWNRGDAALNQHIFNVKENSGIITRRYLYYAVRAAMTLIRSRIHGATMQHITKPVFEAIPIPLPSLTDQHRITDVLDKADVLRQKRRDAIRKSDELVQSVFIDQFGDPKSNPKAWPERALGELVDEVTYGTSSKAGDSGEFPVLRMNNITYAGSWDFSSLKYMELLPGERERYLVRQGDILFNRTNSKELVGKTAVYRRETPMAYAGYLIRVRANAENDSEYISAFLNSRYGKAVLQNMCKSIIGMANINATELKSIRIMQPDTKLQRRFAEAVRTILTEKEKMLQAAKLTDDLFAGLQHRLFSGTDSV